MKKIRLQLQSTKKIVSGLDINLLILVDQNNERQIAFVCSKELERQLALRVNNNPIKNTLLPEVMCWINPDMNKENYEILFSSISGGEYKVILINKITFEMLPISAPDAVLLATVAGLDMFIEEKLFYRQSMIFDETKEKISLPLNILSQEMLEEALNKAIIEEDFEVASCLRDELKRRTPIK